MIATQNGGRPMGKRAERPRRICRAKPLRPARVPAPRSTLQRADAARLRQLGRRFVAFHGQKHPRQLDAEAVRSFLDHLVEQRVSKSTHQQALCALQFLYEQALRVEMPFVDGLRRPQRQDRLPLVLSREEVRTVLGLMSGTPRLMASLMYGAGLRLLECARLRVKDLELDGGRILVREGKGQRIESRRCRSASRPSYELTSRRYTPSTS